MKSLKNFLGMEYWMGAVILALLNILLFWYSKKPWGVTNAMSIWGAQFLNAIGFKTSHWLYFAEIQIQDKIGDYQPLFIGTLLNIGIILGAFFASFIYKEFRIRHPRNKKLYLAALLGGLLMGYGARLAGGCSIGALVSGMASFSLHGLIFGVFLVPGVWIGLKLSHKYFY